MAYLPLPGVFYRLLLRMLRGSQPTIRPVVSDCGGTASPMPNGETRSYACRGSTQRRSHLGQSGGLMPQLLCRLIQRLPKRQFACLRRLADHPSAAKSIPKDARAADDRRMLRPLPREVNPHTGSAAKCDRSICSYPAACSRLSGTCSAFVLSACSEGVKAAKPTGSEDQAHLDSAIEIPT